MRNRLYTSVNDAFIDLADTIYNHPEYVSSPRGMETRENLGVSITIINPYDRIVTNSARKFSLRYGIGEWLWYDRESNSLEEIAYYSKFWNKVSDNGETVNSAYGYRIRGSDRNIPLDQWVFIRDELKRDKDSRRAICIIASPYDMIAATKDFPCTVYLQFVIREGKLHLLVNMRSNDLVLGFANDVFAFTLMQEKMLVELQLKYPELKMGNYHHFAGSMHIYANKYDLVEAALAQERESIEHTLMPRMADLNQLLLLQQNERRIREHSDEELASMTDPFCVFCQNVLMDIL